MTVDRLRIGTLGAARVVPTTPEDAVAGLTVIDAVYRAAGLPPRGA